MVSRVWSPTGMSRVLSRRAEIGETSGLVHSELALDVEDMPTSRIAVDFKSGPMKHAPFRRCGTSVRNIAQAARRKRVAGLVVRIAGPKRDR